MLEEGKTKGKAVIRKRKQGEEHTDRKAGTRPPAAATNHSSEMLPGRKYQSKVSKLEFPSLSSNIDLWHLSQNHQAEGNASGF